MEASMRRPSSAKCPVNCKTFLREDNGRYTDFYRTAHMLGEGASGDVWLAHQRVHPGTEQEHEGRAVAIKRVRKPNPGLGLDEQGADSEEALEDFRNEVDLMKSLDHPSICRLLRVYEDAKNLYLVMEHIQGGELFDRIVKRGFFDESVAAQVVQQIASALAYCHQHGVVHRDIKPENIMVVDQEVEDATEDECTVKVIDFSFSCRILEGVQLKAKVGTFLYTAPEVLKGEACNEKQDLWALGCVLFCLLSGNAPFFGPNSHGQITDGSFSFGHEVWSGISDAAKDLINGLLVVDPSKRLSAGDVHRHPWLAPCEQAAHGTLQKRQSLNNLERLENFHNQTLMRHVCSAVLARQLDESLLHRLHCTFYTLDDDEDGLISLEEFQRACREVHEQSNSEGLSSQELAAAFQDVDMDGSGHIDYTEFIAACIDRKIESQEGACWAAFQVFDLDSNGEVSYDELRQVMTSASLQETFSQQTMLQVWQQLMGDEKLHSDELCKEGRIDFDHFLAALRGVQVAPAAGLPPSAKTAERAGAQPQHAPKAGAAVLGLPIARRQHAAATSMGLPISKRQVKLGLPIVNRNAGFAAKLAPAGLGEGDSSLEEAMRC